MLRGISGGQRKRVTSGEALVGHAKVLYADEISTGLDSNTTHQVRYCLPACMLAGLPCAASGLRAVGSAAGPACAAACAAAGPGLLPAYTCLPLPLPCDALQITKSLRNVCHVTNVRLGWELG